MNNFEKISVKHKTWIDYGYEGLDGYVLLIKLDKTGQSVTFNTKGCQCMPIGIKGHLVKKFKTSMKWFQPKFWYDEVNHNDNGDIVLIDKKYDWSDFTSKRYDIETLTSEGKARSPKDILKVMVQEVSEKTGLKLSYDEDLRYWYDWFESFIPVTHAGEKYLITWENCD